MTQHSHCQGTGPSIDELQAELSRSRRHNVASAILRSVATLIMIAVFALAAAFLFFPVMRIQGESMAPTLQNGDIVVAIKGSSYEPGDLIAFYYHDKLLVKRVIAAGGSEIFISPKGAVYVNGSEIHESYISGPALGDCDLSFPYTVPAGRIFAMGDHRVISLDSRSNAIGCIAQEQIIGRVVLRLWPIHRFECNLSASFDE